MCGEQSRLELRTRFVLGSPPRVRGTVLARVLWMSSKRITPACAGNSLYFDLLPRALQDHPRVCGEQFCVGVPTGKVIGSPPRVRGTANEVTTSTTTDRITPACAGNSGGSYWMRTHPQDHPRVCGEQRLPGRYSPTGRGSPPRVRGTD